ncbi:CoA-binding protein [Chloroflexota bacterium]
MQSLIKEFISQKKFAIVGATENPEKYGNKVFKNLTSRGYEVYPVNPNLKELEGVKAYAKFGDIPVKVDVVDFVVPPAVTKAVLWECKQSGLNRVWLQPGSENADAIAYCHKNNMKVVYGACVMQN